MGKFNFRINKAIKAVLVKKGLLPLFVKAVKGLVNSSVVVTDNAGVLLSLVSLIKDNKGFFTRKHLLLVLLKLFQKRSSLCRTGWFCGGESFLFDVETGDLYVNLTLTPFYF